LSLGRLIEVRTWTPALVGMLAEGADDQPAVAERVDDVRDRQTCPRSIGSRLSPPIRRKTICSASASVWTLASSFHPVRMASWAVRAFVEHRAIGRSSRGVGG